MKLHVEKNYGFVFWRSFIWFVHFFFYKQIDFYVLNGQRVLRPWCDFQELVPETMETGLIQENQKILHSFCDS